MKLSEGLGRAEGKRSKRTQENGGKEKAKTRLEAVKRQTPERIQDQQEKTRRSWLELKVKKDEKRKAERRRVGRRVAERQGQTKLAFCGLKSRSRTTLERTGIVSGRVAVASDGPWPCTANSYGKRRRAESCDAAYGCLRQRPQGRSRSGGTCMVAATV